MNTHFKPVVLFVVFLTLFSACATYHVSTQSLLEQFAETQPEKKVNFIVAFPLVFPGVVTGNNLTELKCLDKNGKETVIPVTNRTGVKITKNDSTHVIFYFDTLLIKDSTITGKKSHFIGINIKPINLNDISRIEIQK